jgi:hypothetical protein
MTRNHAARRLLEHGPLTLAEFLAITGWPYRAAQATLTRLLDAGDVEAEKDAHRNTYRIALGSQEVVRT